MFFYIVLTLTSTTSGLGSTGNTRKYQQIVVYIYQCESVEKTSNVGKALTLQIWNNYGEKE